jgi:hypothetical protein
VDDVGARLLQQFAQGSPGGADITQQAEQGAGPAEAAPVQHRQAGQHVHRNPGGAQTVAQGAVFRHHARHRVAAPDQAHREADQRAARAVQVRQMVDEQDPHGADTARLTV